jgi:hypothetical protein
MPETAADRAARLALDLAAAKRRIAELEAAESRVQALAKQFDEAGPSWHGTLIRVALSRPDVSGWRDSPDDQQVREVPT